MKQVKLSWEEVIKIQLSYRIIKSDSIDCSEEGISFIDTKIDYCAKESFLVQALQDKEYEDIIDLDHIREVIHKGLILETEQERLKIIKDGKKEAENLKLAAKQNGYEEGLKEGYEQGYRKGIKAAQHEGLIIKNNALSLIDQAHKYISSYLAENHNNIIKLAASMAESIVHTTIDESSERIIMLIKPILQQFGKKGNIIITCNPDNIAHVRCYLHELEESCPDAKLIILEDGNLEKNGCVIENENSIIDLQIKGQLNSIIEEIYENKNLE